MSVFDAEVEALIRRTADVVAAAMYRRSVDKEIERRVQERLAAEEMSAAEVATLLGIHRSTLNTWRQGGGFPAPRKNPNGSIRFMRSQVEAWRAARPLSELKVPS